MQPEGNRAEKRTENMNEVVVAILSAAVTNWATYFIIKRAVRKRGGPEWAAYGFAKIAALVQAHASKEQFGLTPEQILPAIENWVESRDGRRFFS